MGESIAAASSDGAEAKAIYRLLKRKNFTEEAIMDSHRKQTIKNMQESGETVILSVQDTSDLDYTNLKATVGLGEHGGKTHSRGLILHTNIAITTDGIALGLLDQKAWARDPAERGKRKTRHERPIEEKESYKCLESMEKSNRDIPNNIKLVNVCDREGDIFEFFHKAIVDNRDFLVRVVHNRKLDKELRLFEKVHSEKALGTVVVEIPRDTRKNIKGRKATIEIRCVKVLLPVPPRAKVDKNISVEINLILASEIDAPEGIVWNAS